MPKSSSFWLLGSETSIKNFKACHRVLFRNFCTTLWFSVNTGFLISSSFHEVHWDLKCDGWWDQEPLNSDRMVLDGLSTLFAWSTWGCISSCVHIPGVWLQTFDLLLFLWAVVRGAAWRWFVGFIFNMYNVLSELLRHLWFLCSTSRHWHNTKLHRFSLFPLNRLRDWWKAWSKTNECHTFWFETGL